MRKHCSNFLQKNVLSKSILFFWFNFFRRLRALESKPSKAGRKPPKSSGANFPPRALGKHRQWNERAESLRVVVIGESTTFNQFGILRILVINYQSDFNLCSTSFFTKWALPGLYFVCFLLFYRQTMQSIQQTNVKKCPSIIQCWDSNPRPSGCHYLHISIKSNNW